MEVIALLEKQHDEMMQMLTELKTSEPGRARSETFRKLQRSLLAHMYIEEEGFYPAIIGRTPEEDDEARTPGAQRVSGRRGRPLHRDGALIGSPTRAPPLPARVFFSKVPASSAFEGRDEMNLRHLVVIIALASCAAPKAGDTCTTHLEGTCDDDKNGFLLCERHDGKQTWNHFACKGCVDNGRTISCDLSQTPPGACASTAIGWQLCNTASDGSRFLAICYANPRASTSASDDRTGILEWQTCSTCDSVGCTP